MRRRMQAFVAALALAAAGRASADTRAFDLAGPVLQVEVTHGSITLPIGSAPALAAGDRLFVKADLPASQSARYLLVVAFLRGATNPPPKSWFHRLETWTAKGRQGLTLEVPADAQQALVFLAPQTGGDFGTLMSAVRGRPGAFVRAAQDLNQASLDRERLDAYLAGLRHAAAEGPAPLKAASPLLARSLKMKLDADCFTREPDLQAACLSQGQDALVLDDGRGRTLAEALTSGPTSDLAFQLSASPVAGYGATSAYIGAAFDIVRILDSFRTAQFQYIPALGTAQGDRLQLRLNTAPSFQNPRSVLVAALPPVEPAQPPSVRAVDPADAYCAVRPNLVLPAEGAPLLYATGYAHDLVLRVTGADGRQLSLPVTADAARGGLVVAAPPAAATLPTAPLKARLHGFWGFTPFEGPEFSLQAPTAGSWRLADDVPLVAGREDVVKLQGEAPACVRDVALTAPGGAARVLSWKAAADGVTATIPLADAEPGAMALRVSQYGRAEPVSTPVQVLRQAARLDAFSLNARDATARLTGARLDEVAGVAFAGVHFTPGDRTSGAAGDTLELAAADPAASAALAAGRTAQADVSLKDGRVLRIKATVAPARPQASVIGMSRTPAQPAPFILGDAAEVARGAILTFSLHADAPTRFAGNETVEVADAQGAHTTTLTFSGGLVRVDPQVLVATLNTGKALDDSVSGPLRYRVLQDGLHGDWRPLATLVRTPHVSAVRCPPGAGPCRLTGDDLFLISEVSADPTFAAAESVPDGYTAATLSVPRPADGRLFVRLRDDPKVVSILEPGAASAPVKPAAASG